MIKEKRLDLVFLVVVYALLALGLVTTTDILITSSWLQRMDSPDHFFARYILRKYLFFISTGTLLAFTLHFIQFDLKKILSRFEFWLTAAVILPILPLIFPDYSMHLNGCTRYFGFHYLWIHTGFWSCVFYLISSAIITTGEEKLNRFRLALLIIGTALIGLCLLWQPDLPMLLTLFFMISGFLIFNDKKVTACSCITVTCTLFFLYLIFKSGYEIPRIIAFYDLADSWGASFQIIESRKCFQIGGLFGAAASCMPPQPFDLLFAVFVSKYGFTGVMFFLALHALFFILGFRGTSLVKDKTQALVLKGFLFMLAFFSAAGIAASASMLPIFYDIPFGYGGTLMIFSILVAGLLFRSLWVNRNEEEGQSYLSLLKPKPIICYLVILFVIAVRCAYLCSL
jgi:cell division protein FtsW (lipid II flippase)